MGTVILVLAIAFALSWIPAMVVYLIARRRDSGERVITCPETCSTEVVRVDAGHAAWTDMSGEKDLRLEACSRWPERADCGQDCLAEIECAPEGCLVRERLTSWYRDASCVLCGMEIGPVQWYDHRPGLRGPEGRTLFWDEVSATELPAVLRTHQPICFDCLIAESFREKFPDRVLDDPWHKVDRRETRSPGSMA
ncbi:MAG: hypothetical protein M3542_00415 [Acidobacteriota bacterium]|nr:hypothetical protein [Acidobacteriota bacterium]MDQ5872473.1 hypothetical protein [Acidobacteriota bacterium]